MSDEMTIDNARTPNVGEEVYVHHGEPSEQRGTVRAYVNEFAIVELLDGKGQYLADGKGFITHLVVARDSLIAAYAVERQARVLRAAEAKLLAQQLPGVPTFRLQLDAPPVFEDAGQWDEGAWVTVLMWLPARLYEA